MDEDITPTTTAGSCAPDQSGPPKSGAYEPETKPGDQERTLALICHLLPFCGFLAPAIPGVNLIAPLVLWLLKREGNPFLDAHGKEVLNLQLNLAVVFFVCALTFWLLIPIAVAVATAITALVFIIKAAMATSEGKLYRYPFIFRVIR
jgi:uncharacterized Tic20 family protein